MSTLTIIGIVALSIAIVLIIRILAKPKIVSMKKAVVLGETTGKVKSVQMKTARGNKYRNVNILLEDGRPADAMIVPECEVSPGQNVVVAVLETDTPASQSYLITGLK